MKGRLKRLGVIFLAAAWLGGCGAYLEGTILEPAFWQSGGPLSGKENNLAELGMAEMAKGNYALAELNYNKAIKANPQDVHALLGLGVLYQNTGRTVRAREMYQAIVALRPDNTKQSIVWSNLTPLPIAKIASVNLGLLDSGMAAPAVVFSRAAPAFAGRQGSQAVEHVTQPTMGGLLGLPPGQGGQGNLIVFSKADVNIASRFRTLMALRDQGLITEDEYAARRQANVGGLLPLSSPPPGAGLDRPVPTTNQITGRLKAISRALEMRALTVSQHSSERSMILNALLPAAPVNVANPGMPPKGLMEAADGVRRLEMLKAAGLITSDEYSKERAAIEKNISPLPMRPASSTASGGAMPSGAGPYPAVHLASYKSRKDAVRGWTQLRRAHSALLRGLRYEVARVNLGAGKGIYYRLKAGPLANKSEASSLCRKLKSRRQYCEPSFMNSNG